MANPEHVEILKQGVEVWNEWRKEHPDVRPDLSQVNLEGEELSKLNLSNGNLRESTISGVDLSATNLFQAELVEAYITNVNFTYANLALADFTAAYIVGVNFYGSILVRANFSRSVISDALAFAPSGRVTHDLIRFRHADMRESCFQDASLTRPNFTYAILSGADFSNTEIQAATFEGNDLRNTIGLATVRHKGPSHIDIDTIYLSEGKIPEAFLLGCGIPEAFITQMPDLVKAIQPIQFSSCFISYNNRDELFARRLYARMKEAGLRVWFAPEDIRGGDKIHEQIFKAIQFHDKVLLVLSVHSLRSEWVMTEVRRARKVEKEDNRRKLFPIRLIDFDAIQKWECFDADSGKDLAVEVREYFIPDFSNWKDHDSFERAFDRLLRDLRAEEKKA